MNVSIFIFLFFLFTTGTCFSDRIRLVDTMINDPFTMIEGKVNAITGYPSIYKEDLVIQGAEPIRLSRIYIHSEVDGYWKLPGNLCDIYQDGTSQPGDKDFHWIINEADGCPIYFKPLGKECKIDGEKYSEYYASNLNYGFSNTCKGEISSRTNHHNYRVFFDKKSAKNNEKPRHVFVHSPDGRVREYKRVDEKPSFYLLISEHLPNGNWILYKYGTDEKAKENFNKLLSIETRNPSKTQVFASADFKHFYYKESKDREEKFSITGSDGQKIDYYCKGGKQHLHFSFKHLKNIDSSSFPSETFHYTQFCDESLGINKKKYEEDRLEILSRPLSRQTKVSYYTKCKEKVAGQEVKLEESSFHFGLLDAFPRRDFRMGRVKEILAPVGNSKDLRVTHSFIYNSEHQTTVYDYEGKKTVYYADESSRLRKIERFSRDGNLVSSDRYAWKICSELAGLIINKSLADEMGNVISSLGFSYDSIGNVLEKKFYGNLTGSSAPPASTNAVMEGNVEFTTTKYSYTEGRPSLLSREEHPSGLVKRYTYLEGTDRVTSELTCSGDEVKTRKFWEYTDGILTRQITDDGSFSNAENLTNVTYRSIHEIVPNSDGSYVGLPHFVYEKYFENGTEKLLSKHVYKYGKAGKITEVEVFDSNGDYRYTLFKEYDEKNRLSYETDAIGRKAFSSYDPLGNLIYSVDFSGRVEVKTEYDFSNRPYSILQKGDEGIVYQTSCSYNGLHQLLKKVDPQGHATQYEYDPLGRCTKTEFPSIACENNALITPVTKQKYDAAGNVIESIDAVGNITKTSYNAYNKPLCTIYPDGSTDTYSYSLDGNLKIHTSPKSVKTEYTHDYLDRVVNKKVFSSKGELLSEESFQYKGDLLCSKTDAMGNTTSFTYDGAGRKIKEECQGETVLYEYDALNRLYKEQKGGIILVTERDLLDRVIEEKTETPDGHVFRRIGYEYDQAGNKKTIIHYIAGDEQREKLEYDSQNRLNFKEDPFGFIELTVHNDFFVNEFGQKILQTIDVDPLGLEIYKTYNPHQQIAKVEKRNKKTLKKEEKFYTLNGELSLNRETVFRLDGSSHLVDTRWEYDSRGRVLALIEAANSQDPKVTKHTYTPTEELETTHKPDGVILNYTYNDLGFHTSLTSSDGSVDHQMEYDRLGNLTSFDGIKREYDFAGRLKKEFLSNGMTLVNEYDRTGRRIYCRIPEAQCEIVYTYHGPDLQRVSRKCSKKGLQYQHHYKNWDHSGNLLEEELLENKGAISYTIDPRSRRQQIKAPHFQQEILEFDPVGNIRKMRIQGDEIEYDYDDLYQLTSESGLFTHRYQFDSLHNRLQKDAEDYEVNERNELISHMEHDLNGNPLKNGQTSYSYDALDRLVKVETPESVETYTYDFLHRRQSKTRVSKKGTEDTYFLYDGLNEIGSYDPTKELKELRVLGYAPHAEIGAAISIELNGEVYVPVHDLQGNIATLIPLDSTTTTTYRYSAFGEESRDGEVLSPWRFSSKRTDETGLVYYGRRYYCPQFGRWHTPDPSGFTDGMNLYAFVHNNSLIHLDEYGLFLISAPSCNFGNAKTFSEQFNRIQPMLTNPLVQGGMQALTGFGELSAGAGIAYGSGLLAAPLGFAVMGHGLDHIFTGMKTAITGSHAETATSQILQKIGVSKGTANLIDNGISIGGFAKGSAVALSTQSASFSRLHLPHKGTPNINLNRFHQAAYNLSEAGQNNIRILRGWAKSKGWQKLPNPNGKPEKWGTYQRGKFEWMLRIKPESSLRPGLDVGSDLPRFDARLSADRGGQAYINPFTGEVGGKKIGRHLSLEGLYER